MEWLEELQRRWERFADTVARPGGCLWCGHPRVLWNGFRIRSASVWGAGRVVHLPRIRCRRVRCQACRRSWTLRPRGLMPQRHYQLSVIAEAMASYLLEPESSQAGVARAMGCARRTVGRWLRWLAGVAEPRDLQRHLLAVSQEPVLPSLGGALVKIDAVRDAVRRQLLERAAEILSLIEALAQALGLEPPGLVSVVEAVLSNRARISSDRSPRIPEFARRQLPGVWGRLAM